MLVLSRRAGESIRISDNIVISVQRVAGNRIVLGIEAPKEVSIRRGELSVEGEAAEAVAEADSEPAPEKRPLSGRISRRRDDAARDKNAASRRGVGAAPVATSIAAWSAAHMS